MYCEKCGSHYKNTSLSDNCSVCGFTLDSRRTPAGSAGTEIPWENLRSQNLIKAFFKTVFYSMTKPASFFGEAALLKEPFNAIVFALTIGSITIIVQFIELIAFQYSGINPSHYFFSYEEITQSTFVLSPVFMVLRFITISLYCHIMLMVTARKKNSFTSTFISICYAQSPMVLSVIPFSGEIIGSVWSLYLIITGLSRAHSTSRSRILSSLLMPVIIIFSLIFLSLFILSLFGIVANGLIKDIF